MSSGRRKCSRAPVEGHVPGSYEARTCRECGPGSDASIINPLMGSKPKTMGRDIEKEMGLPHSYTLVDEATQERAARDETDTETLGAILKYSHDVIRVRRAVALNENTDPYDLKELARDDSLPVRLAAAQNTSTPEESLGSMARSSNAAVAITAIANKSTPKAAIVNASYSGDAGVRKAVARSEKADEEVLARLTNDPDEGVREATKFMREMRGI